MRTYLAAGLVACLALGACSAENELVAAATATTNTVIGEIDLGSEAVGRVSTTLSDDGPGLDPQHILDQLALIDDGVRTTTTVPASTTTESDQAGQPPATNGSGMRPATTVAANPGQPVGYIGIIGNLGADEQVVAPVASPPVAGPGVYPLTGQAGAVPNRAAVVVKVDNGSAARPQTGLNAADIVVEEEVEGGLTRFAAIFHSQSSIVGPVRSGRTTDIGVLLGLRSPVLLYSGANDTTDALLLARSQIQNRSAARSSGYYRNRSRRAPSNLYTDTAPHWASAGGSTPPAWFTYRSTPTATQGTPHSSFGVAFRGNSVKWEWDGGAWLRSQGGRAHTVASGERVSAANVVVIETERVATGMTDSSGATVPEFPFVGTGKATVFTGGHKVDGVWTKPTLASVATLTTSGGDVITLAPGRTWLELIEGGLLR